MSAIGTTENNVTPVGATRATGPVKPRAARGVLRQFELQEIVQSYDPSADVDALGRAYIFAVQRHGSQERKSGDPYFAHPIEVAGILTELRLDTNTIIAALLHDTVEDTDTSLEEIEAKFSADVAQLVNGVTKLTKLEVQSERTASAENFSKFVSALAKDPRVLLVKLADRLHNMRTLSWLAPAKRKRIAEETSEIYAPLARRIGVSSFANELEDLAFEHLHKEAFDRIGAELDSFFADSESLIDDVISSIKNALSEAGIHASVSARKKRPFSIWRKLQRKHVQLKELADLVGFRIIVENRDQCYVALGQIHRVWHAVPNRLKDYISSPKPNGYRSLHTTIFGPQRRKVEVQIRSERMDAVAERGVAAHWRYKDLSYGYHPEFKKGDRDPVAELRAFVDALKDGSDPEEFLRDAKQELDTNQIFVFSPKGHIYMLPYGATAIDFAYAVHTSIGDTMIGVRINNENRPNRTELQDGDVIEILRGKTRRALPNWESLARTTKARSAIRRLIRETSREQEIHDGRETLEAFWARLNIEASLENFERAVQHLRCKDIEDLFVSVARGHVTTQDAAEAIVPGGTKDIILSKARIAVVDDHGADFVTGEGVDSQTEVHFSTCCSPLPGERILGVASGQGSIYVHTAWCEKLIEFENDDNWVDLAWTQQALQSSFAVARIRAACRNRKGVFGQVGRVIAERDGNITYIRAINRGEDFIDMDIDVEVASLQHLFTIEAALRALSVVGDVRRVPRET